MMKKGLIFSAVFGLSGCLGETAARSFDDPAVQQLFTMSTPQYYATLTLANAVAQNCARYRYDAALDSTLNSARNEVGRGSLAANALREAIELETDVSRRSFEAKHGVEVTGGDLCAAGDAESVEGSPLSAMLVSA